MTGKAGWRGSISIGSISTGASTGCSCAPSSIRSSTTRHSTAQRLAEMAELLPFRVEIQALEEARWRLEPLDSQAAAARLSKLPDQIKQLRERLDRGKKAASDEKKPADTKPAEMRRAPSKDAPAAFEAVSLAGPPHGPRGRIVTAIATHLVHVLRWFHARFLMVGAQAS